jgi:cytochrome c peroxidase
VGVPQLGPGTGSGAPLDFGFGDVIGNEFYRFAFRVAPLRNVELTAPYMHNGVYRTLEEVIEHYERGGDVKDNLAPDIKPLKLTAREKADLVRFMKSLTGKPMKVAVPQLPN